MELWDYLTTASTSTARAEGYLYHSIALAHRARRCQHYWTKHLQNCRVLLASLPAVPRGAVLGSGLMLETPLDLLLEKFEHVDLIDVVHPKSVQAEVRRHPKRERVRLLEVDLNLISAESFKGLYGNYDFAVSANLLSQLPFVLGQNMRKNKIAEEEISRFAADLQNQHLQFLRSLVPKFLCYSDFEMHVLDKNAQIIEMAPTVSAQVPIRWQSTWMWELAPAPELSRNYSVHLKVGAASI